MSETREYSGPATGARQVGDSRQSTPRYPSQTSTPTVNDRPSMKTTSTRSTGPYTPNFEQHLIDNNVFPDEYEYPDGQAPELPSNWEEINERLRVPRKSLSPSRFNDQDFRKFKKAHTRASKEKQVMNTVLPIIQGSIKDAQCTSGGVPFRNLDPLTNEVITPGNPDIYYGARPEQLNQRVRQELKNFIVPSKQDSLPICPNFFVAVKDPDGCEAVAERQTLYDGALGARGMYSLQSYRQPRSVSNKASTISSSYIGAQLRMYTIHYSESGGLCGQPGYYMHLLGAWAMIGGIETFRQAVTAYRNARDWAEEERNKAIDKLRVL